MNPDLLAQLRSLFAPDATRAPKGKRQQVPVMRERMANEMPIAPEPTTAQKAVSVAQEFIPGFAEGMGARRAVEAATEGRLGKAGTEAALAAASAIPLVGEARGAKKAIRAYHGSPYTFEKFSDEHLLSGEGAMARGGGHYTATMMKEAEPYRQGRGMPFLDGQMIRKPKGPEVATPEIVAALEASNLLEHARKRLVIERRKDAGMAAPTINWWGSGGLSRLNKALDKEARKLVNSDESYQRALESATQRMQGGGLTADEYERVVDLLGSRRVQENPGRMYTLEINADPTRYLNWNAPVLDQPEFARNILRNPSSPELREAVASAVVRRKSGGGGPMAEDVVRQLENLFIPKDTKLAEAGKQGLGAAQIKARDVLRDEGLEFTRYTPSGGVKERGQHLIVYDPERIRILRMLAAAGVVGAQQELAQMESSKPEM